MHQFCQEILPLYFWLFILLCPDCVCLNVIQFAEREYVVADMQYMKWETIERSDVFTQT